MSCQVCGLGLENVLSLGYMPPVNDYEGLGEAKTFLPTDLKRCSNCGLVQLGHEAEPEVVFPKSYPYTSGTTKALRDNFIDLAAECTKLCNLKADDLVVDIGSNDGTLLSNFKTRRLGVEPTDVGGLARKQGIATNANFFTYGLSESIVEESGQAKVITCTNCYAHMPMIHNVTAGIDNLLRDDGVFVTESHYLISLLDKLQYDTIYHEHLRYYSLHSLKYLLNIHELEIFRVQKTDIHGGSIRVFACKGGHYPYEASILKLLDEEPYDFELKAKLSEFEDRVVASRRNLMTKLYEIKESGQKICGVGAPSRASTVINYCGIDHNIIDYVCEVPGSLKIGKYMPGTLIPVVDERKLIEDQPEYAVLFSWHIAGELEPKLRAKGYKGEFIMPC